MKLTVDQITDAAKGALLQRGPDSCSGVSTDSRTIESGRLFIPLVGDKFDGHDYIEQSLNRGAAGFMFSKEKIASEKAVALASAHKAFAIAVENTLEALGELARFARNSIRGLRVAAITGSTGKSTTKEMTAAILSQSMRVAKNEGNLNNLIGLPRTLLDLPEEIDAAVVEMGTNMPGEIARLAEIANPDVACVTNVGPVHLEGLGTIEGVAGEKGSLPASLSNDKKFAVNCDDPYVAKMAKRTNAGLVCYGVKGRYPSNCIEAVTAFDMRTREEFSKMTLVSGGEMIEVRISAPGIHNAINALAAASICRAMNIPVSQIAQGLEKWRPMKMRNEIKRLPGGITVIVDCYNSNPTSLSAALSMLDAFSGRKIAVIGDMLELGKYSEQAHFEAGQAAAKSGAAILVAVGDWAQVMKAGFEKAAPIPTEAVVVKDAEKAAIFLSGTLKEKDVVLLKGSRKLHLETIVESLVNRMSDNKGGD